MPRVGEPATAAIRTRHDEHAPRRKDPAQLGQGLLVLDEVFEDVEAHDEIEGTVVVGHVADIADIEAQLGAVDARLLDGRGR